MSSSSASFDARRPMARLIRDSAAKYAPSGRVGGRLYRSAVRVRSERGTFGLAGANSSAGLLIVNQCASHIAAEANP
jgi:hypothetical protein